MDKFVVIVLEQVGGDLELGKPAGQRRVCYFLLPALAPPTFFSQSWPGKSDCLRQHEGELMMSINRMLLIK